jgi:hypothetical protein
MMNLKKLEKSRGILLFAFNSDSVDYVEIANYTSKLMDKYLDLPITLVTDTNVQPKFCYHNVIKVITPDGNYRLDKRGNAIKWKNFNRFSAYDLSPYYETLVLDVDYLVLGDSLSKLFDQDFDYRLMHKMQTVEGISNEEMGSTSLPLVWATSFIFKKTQKSKLFFNLVNRIQKNYTYYKILYNMRDSSYRNDHAFAIANIVLNGYHLSQEQSIPWPMMTIKNDIKSLSFQNNFIFLKNYDKAFVLPKQDLHIMDKDFLTSADFKQFVDAACNE